MTAPSNKFSLCSIPSDDSTAARDTAIDIQALVERQREILSQLADIGLNIAAAMAGRPVVSLDGGEKIGLQGERLRAYNRIIREVRLIYRTPPLWPGHPDGPPIN